MTFEKVALEREKSISPSNEYSPPNKWRKYRTYDAKQEEAYRRLLSQGDTPKNTDTNSFRNMRNMLQYYSQKYNMAGQTSSFRTLQKIGENLAKKREIYHQSEHNASTKYSSNPKQHSKKVSEWSFITLDSSILMDP